PYDIARVGENDYRITVVTAGFAPEELAVTQEANALVVSGARKSESGGEYLHRGIVDRSFQRRFDLADHVRVTGARLEHGLLTIELHRD
ncbi:Hsp20 family protein, partial [Acinetobacter baumannii]